MELTCPKCARTFNSTKKLSKHLRYSPVHKGDAHRRKSGRKSQEYVASRLDTQPSSIQAPSFDCIACDRQFVSESALQQHLQTAAAHQPPTIPSFDMRPSLHRDVLFSLQQYGLSFEFCSDDDDLGCVEECDTFVKGDFVCPKKTCWGKRWLSGKIATTIRQYPDSSYNARIYFQRCMACDSLCEPQIDDSYAERVSWRLAKWAGLDPPTPPYSQSTSRPHEREFCEGCRLGHCERGRFRT